MPARTSLFAFDPGIDANTLIAHCKDWGIDELILHPGFFADTRMEAALRNAGMSLWLNLPVFYNPAYLEAHPEHYAITSKGRRAIHDWCHFVCPTAPGYLEQLSEEYHALVRRLQPARISLDFIRHFVFWELVALDGRREDIEDGCYCPRCLAAFSQATGVKVPNQDAAVFIQKHALAAWGRWKVDGITAAATRLVSTLRQASPASEWLIKLIPWREDQLDGAILNAAGQDIRALASLVDAVVPMAFSHILRRDLAWKEALLKHVSATTGKPTACYVQTNQLFRNEEIPPAQVEAELRAALSHAHAAVPIFWYEQLAQSPAVIDTVRGVLKAG